MRKEVKKEEARLEGRLMNEVKSFIAVIFKDAKIEGGQDFFTAEPQ